jgi:hypothetical protein
MKRVFLAVLCGVAIDLTLAALHGYKFRRPLWETPAPADLLLVLVLEAAFLALVIVPLGLVLRRCRWPRFAVLTAALAPIVVNRLIRRPGLGELAALTAVGAVVVAVALLERRRVLPAVSRLEVGVVVGIGLLASCGAVSLPSLAPLPIVAPSGVADGRPATAASPNLLLIVLDTVRADHLGVYGYARDTSPWLDGFSRRATVFEHAVAPSSFTLPSHATLFTGLYPEAHGAGSAPRADRSPISGCSTTGHRSSPCRQMP